MSAPEDLYAAATAAMQHAYVPYSKFPVGCAMRGDDGKIYAGCNVENASYSLTLCAESSAIGQLISTGANHITEILIIIPGDQLCPPCGACRQRLFELASGDTTIHLATTNGKYHATTVDALMPLPFGSDLLEDSC